MTTERTPSDAVVTYCTYYICAEKDVGPHEHESKGGRITKHAEGRCDRGLHLNESAELVALRARARAVVDYIGSVPINETGQPLLELAYQLRAVLSKSALRADAEKQP